MIATKWFSIIPINLGHLLIYYFLRRQTIALLIALMGVLALLVEIPSIQFAQLEGTISHIFQYNYS